MITEAIVVTLVASLSGLAIIWVSFYFLKKLERRRLKLELLGLKLDTARKLFGNKHNMAGKEFQEAMNETMIIFSDSTLVIKAMQDLRTTLQIPGEARTLEIADEKFALLMDTLCKDIGVKYKDLPDSCYKKFYREIKDFFKETCREMLMRIYAHIIVRIFSGIIKITRFLCRTLEDV